MPYYADLRPNQPSPEWKGDEGGREFRVDFADEYLSGLAGG
jgi:hypothetical protein